MQPVLSQMMMLLALVMAPIILLAAPCYFKMTHKEHENVPSQEVAYQNAGQGQDFTNLTGDVEQV